MALQYVEKFGGYIADVPDIDFTRCDGKMFHYDQVNTAGVTNTKNSLTITGGQGQFPQAFIDTDATLEMTFASSQFTMDMFEMANATNAEQKDVGIAESKRYDVQTGQVINLPFEVQTGSVKIRGLEEAETAATGKFKVEITASAENEDGKTVITLAEGDAVVGDIVRVGYVRRVVDAQVVTVKTTSTTSKGSVVYHWPIYSSGTDCTEASIKAKLHMVVPRVRVTALPGFDNSYKSAATNSVTFSAMDPQRPDEKLYDLIYEPLASDGSIVTKSSVAAEDVAWN